MTLDKKDKKILDSMIEEEISKIPGLVRNLRLPQFQEAFQIKNESEYVYGYTHGSIVGKFETYYFVVHSGKKPNNIEVDEIGKTIFEKSNEIRNAISKSS
ncbi:MAG: hypothetical protein KGI28_03360 [Thaumarchaeota archaeon]|nr:hypothetical protein [Nitrososphaerota archaeon]